jgi:hypothetical protein
MKKLNLLLVAEDDETAVRECTLYISQFGRDVEIALSAYKIAENQYSAYFYVSPYMVEGSYYVRIRIRVMDVANNIAEYSNLRSGDEYSEDAYNIDLSHLNFSVSGTLSDTNKPILKGLQFGKSEANSGGLFEFYVETYDEEAGLQYGVLNMVHTQTNQEIQFYMNLNMRGMSFVQHWVQEDFQLGDYVVKSMELVDMVGNYSYYCNAQVLDECSKPGSQPFDFSENTLRILPKGDVQNVEIFDSIFASSNSLQAGDTLTLRVSLKEEYWWANMFFMNFNSASDVYYLMPEFKSKGNGVFEAEVSIDEYRNWSNVYTASSIQLLSGLKNEIFYHVDLVNLDPSIQYTTDLSAFVFNISQDVKDTTPPEFVDISFSKNQYFHNDILRFEVDAIDNESNLEYVIYQTST